MGHFAYRFEAQEALKSWQADTGMDAAVVAGED
jgi:hypothetical protein